MFNEVALTDGGGVYVTEMYDINRSFDELIEAGVAGEDTSSVWYWSAGESF